MKRIVLLITILFSVFSSAQILEPVKWEFSTEKISETEYDLIFKATMDDNWALYSQFIEDGGPIPTTFTFEESDGFELIGNVTEDD